MIYYVLLWIFSAIFAYAVLKLISPWMVKKEWVDLDWFRKKNSNVWVPTVGMFVWLPIFILTSLAIITNSVGLYAVIWLILIAGMAILGFVDDLGRKTRKRIPWLPRFLYTAIFCLVFATLFGTPIHFLNMHIDSPFIYIPAIALFIAGAASFENTFGGINGWTSGSSFIISLGVIALLWNTPWVTLAIIYSATFAAMAKIYAYPAKGFPGDTSPFVAGAALAGLAILSGKVVWMFLFYIPHIFDQILKLWSNRKNIKGIGQKDLLHLGIKPYALGDDGKLHIPKYPDGRIRYDFVKFLIKVLGPQTEKRLAYIIWIVVAINTLAVVLLHASLGA